MKAYSILYDIPSWDPHYRPQRGVRVHGYDEADARRRFLKGRPGDARILRIVESRRNPGRLPKV